MSLRIHKKLLERVNLELHAIYDAVNDFANENTFDNITCIFHRDDYPLGSYSSGASSYKSNKEIFLNSVEFIKFLASTGDFECVFTDVSKKESFVGANDWEFEYRVVDIEEFEKLLFNFANKYGYDSSEVNYYFIIRRKEGKGKITPPEHIPDEVLELFRPISNNVASD